MTTLLLFVERVRCSQWRIRQTIVLFVQHSVVQIASDLGFKRSVLMAAVEDIKLLFGYIRRFACRMSLLHKYLCQIKKQLRCSYCMLRLVAKSDNSNYALVSDVCVRQPKHRLQRDATTDKVVN